VSAITTYMATAPRVFRLRLLACAVGAVIAALGAGRHRTATAATPQPRTPHSPPTRSHARRTGRKPSSPGDAMGCRGRGRRRRSLRAPSPCVRAEAGNGARSSAGRRRSCASRGRRGRPVDRAARTVMPFRKRGMTHGDAFRVDPVVGDDRCERPRSSPACRREGDATSGRHPGLRSRNGEPIPGCGPCSRAYSPGEEPSSSSPTIS
jgi:hypothetical protein